MIPISCRHSLRVFKQMQRHHHLRYKKSRNSTPDFSKADLRLSRTICISSPQTLANKRHVRIGRILEPSDSQGDRFYVAGAVEPNAYGAGHMEVCRVAKGQIT